MVLKNAQVQANFWHKHAVIPLGNNQFEIELQEAPDANRAFFVEAKFPGIDGIGHFEITSEVHIIPGLFDFLVQAGFYFINIGHFTEIIKNR